MVRVLCSHMDGRSFNSLTQFHYAFILDDTLCSMFIQIRLLFNRKNKTLRAVLMTKSVLKLLEENRKTVLALNNDATTNSSSSMQLEGKNDEKSCRDIVQEIVDREPWKGQRASKMDLDDFLQLLTEFNQAGIHFS